MLISLLIYVLTSLTGSRTLGQVTNLQLAPTKKNISISNVTRRNTGKLCRWIRHELKNLEGAAEPPRLNTSLDGKSLALPLRPS